MSVFVDIAGNVGIGTKYPINKFNVVGKSSFTGDLLPSSCNVYDLGFSNLCWRDLYLSGNKINIAGTKISKDENTGGLQILPPGYSNVNANYTYNGSNIILPSSIATINGVNITALNKRTRTSYATAFDSIKSWTLIYIDGTADWYSMCWSPELSALVAVGSDTLSAGGPSQPPTSIVTSYDYGKTWISTTPYNTWDAHFSVCWSSELSLFVAVGTNILTSSDGSSWVYRQTDNRGWKSVCWSSELSLFVAVGDIQDSNDIITSANGIDWTYRTVPEINAWRTVCWSPELSLFVAAGAIADQLTYGFMTSANGISWQLHSSYINTSCVVTSICWSPELSIFVFGGVSGSDNIVITLSPNLTVLYSASIFANYSQYTSVCWSAELSLFVMTGIGVLISSPNGINWTTSSQPAVSNDPVSLCWIPELSCFMAPMAFGQILRSAIALPNAKSVVKALPSQMMVDANGSVGIGSMAPIAPFNVQMNNTTGTGAVFSQIGTSAILDIQKSGVSKVFVDATGNVGIGSTAPLAPLNVQTSNTTGTGVIFSQIGTSAILDVQKSGVSKFFVDADGSVGIGSTSPLAPFNVQTSNTTGTGVIFSQIGTSAILDIQKSGVSKFFMDATGNVGIGSTAPLAPFNVQTSNTTGTGVIFSQIGTSAILDVQKSGASKLFVDTIGNVGVGTTIPSQALHIEGNTYINGSISANNLGVYRNRLINGDMRVNQRGTNNITGTLQAVGATAGYVTDRWAVYRAGYATGANMGHGSNLTSSDLPYSRYGIKTFARVGRVAADTSTASVGIAYGLETQDSLSLAGQTVTCSFFYRTGANYTGMTLNTNIVTGTGTDEGIQRGATITGGISNSNAVPPSSTWAFRSVSAQLGSNATQVGVIMTYSPSNATAAAAADYFDITGIQLEKGNIATPFEFRPYSAELALCQRYFCKLRDADNMGGAATSATVLQTRFVFPVEMRAVGAGISAVAGTWNFSDDSVTNSVATAISTTTTTAFGTRGTRVAISGSAFSPTLTIGKYYGATSVGIGTGAIWVNAEL